MVFNFGISVFLSILRGLFSILPDISWNVTTGSFQSFFSVVGSVAYMLPMQTITAIISLTISFHLFRAVISLIKTIWDLLPIV